MAWVQWLKFSSQAISEKKFETTVFLYKNKLCRKIRSFGKLEHNGQINGVKAKQFKLKFIFKHSKCFFTKKKLHH